MAVLVLVVQSQLKHTDRWYLYETFVTESPFLCFTLMTSDLPSWWVSQKGVNEGLAVKTVLEERGREREREGGRGS